MEPETVANLLTLTPEAMEFATKIFNDHFKIEDFKDNWIVQRDFKHHKKIIIERIMYQVAMFMDDVTGTFEEYLEYRSKLGPTPDIDFCDVLYIREGRNMYNGIPGKTAYNVPDEVVIKFIEIRDSEAGCQDAKDR